MMILTVHRLRRKSLFGSDACSDYRVWLGNLDSNQDKQSQSLLCYRYTIPQRISEQIQWFRKVFGG